MPTIKVETFGCKVNTYDAGLIEESLQRADFCVVGDQPLSHPDVVILNTCAVTGEATRQAARRLRQIRRLTPHTKVVVTGCGAQVDTEKFSEGSGESVADLVVANSHKGELAQILRNWWRGEDVPRVHKSNIFKKSDLGAGGGRESRHTRAFLKVQDGCNSFCTFCIIPFARGRSRSIGIADLVLQVRELLASGVKEVVLTGVHIGDYADGADGIDELVETILRETRVPRLRLSSLEPIEISQRLLDVFQSEPRLCPHFHMSIQSANDRVLSAMKRHYGQKEVRQSLERIAAKIPQAFVGMDVIAGFPGETEEEFADTFDCLADLPWTRLHVFPYSARHGTVAARFSEALPTHVKAARAERLRGLSAERYRAVATAQQGTVKHVLRLRQGDDTDGAYGLSRDYWPVRFFQNGSPSVGVGEEGLVRITQAQISEKSGGEGHLLGEWVAAGLIKPKENRHEE